MPSSYSFVPTAEAAFIADLADRDMNRMVDERILPESLFEKRDGRLFARLAAALARFYFGTEKEFAAELRRRIVAEMASRVLLRPDGEIVISLSGALPRDLDWHVNSEHARINLTSFVIETIERTREIERAATWVRVDEDTLGGEPVFVGTRLPIDIVLASLHEGVELARLVGSYAFLTPEAIEAAQTYARVHPRRGRPCRRLAELHPTWKVKARGVVRPAPKA